MRWPAPSPSPSRSGWPGVRSRTTRARATRSTTPVWPPNGVAAAADAAHGGGRRLVLTARAENLIRGRPDLADTIARLQAYQEAGADVLYAPGVGNLNDIRQIVAAVDRPVNVLALPTAPPVADLAAAGVRRISGRGALRH